MSLLELSDVDCLPLTLEDLYDIGYLSIFDGYDAALHDVIDQPLPDNMDEGDDNAREKKQDMTKKWKAPVKTTMNK